jgi:ABC-type dipeptide/oligopeptide/nickel transport system ATPase component
VRIESESLCELDRNTHFIAQDPMTSLNPTMNIGRQIAEGFIEHRGASVEEGRQCALGPETALVVGLWCSWSKE